MWLEQYALELYLYLLEQHVLLKRPYALELHLLEQRVLLKQYCSSSIVARAECNQAVLAQAARTAQVTVRARDTFTRATRTAREVLQQIDCGLSRLEQRVRLEQYCKQYALL